MATDDQRRAHPDRRRFLTRAAAGAAGAWVVPAITRTEVAAAQGSNPPPQPDRMLDLPASESPIDHLVILMMENRSFDHWLGWLASDAAYLAAGQSRYGPGFGVTASHAETYLDPGGVTHTTEHLPVLLAGGDPYRGCGHPDPGHSWSSGRAQRDGGFLASGSGNDQFAIGYFLEPDLPVSAAMAKRFTVCDHSFASLLGPTYPNREYLCGAQSDGFKNNSFPADGFAFETIFDRLVADGISTADYRTDVPTLALFGTRMIPLFRTLEQYFDDCAAGTLPQVSLLEPGYLTGSRTDNHPHGDVRAGERFVRDAFAAFARSPHWERGLFVLTYDEWGGFYDHLAPPVLPDDRASAVDADNFGQAGFRVPTVLASPYAPRGFVDHQVYDHTSILRFLEWRFFGAPPTGPGDPGDSWFLTTRDRHANNIGSSLLATADVDVDYDLDLAVDPPSPECGSGGGGGALPDAVVERHAFEEARDAGCFDRLGIDVSPSPLARRWATA